MPDQLSQNEIDNLLNEVGSGNIDLDAIPTTPAGEVENPEGVKTYDFKKPERVSTDQINSIKMMHEALARKLEANLSSYLRTIVKVKLDEVTQFTYQEVMLSLPGNTCLNQVGCSPLDGAMVLEINPSIAYPVIEKLLGGKGGEGDSIIPTEREMSDIEWRLISRLTTDTLSLLRECWKPIMDIDFRVIGRESNPQLMQIVPPNEVVILVAFEIAMSNAKGAMNLCIPFPVIEPKIGEFSTIQTWFQTRKTTDIELEASKLNEGIKDAGLKSIVYIGKTRMTMREFLRLKPGDLILTQKNVSDPLLLTIGDRPKFWVYPGQHRHYKAARVSHAASISDSL
ncbi:MAG: flagellar motor switch protein FliM [Planctomycetota bacterium]|jgi:flagellar motor switch protein FliM|nr:flagellar motor switch protein FliM [Planctomycetota bacterium]